MGIRRWFALCMLALLTACRQPTTPEIQAIVQGSSNVQIAVLQILPDNPDTSGSASGVLYVCHVVFTNTGTSDVTPSLDHFVFTSAKPQRSTYRALTSGIPPTINIANPVDPVRAGAKQEYTLVFRPATGATGTIAYQP